MGNTLVQYWCNDSYKDHPHIHGEYSAIFSHLIIVLGSPPHTWGIREKLMTESLLPRITPTYMGNTKLVDQVSPVVEDHPHIHGEYGSY